MKEFLDYLRKEKLETQMRRLEFIKLKFMLIVALLGVGTWEFSSMEDNYLLLYLVPFVGFAIDLYVHGENFAIRRIGFFVKEIVEHDPLERTWELFVDKNRDQFTRIGFNVVSILLFLGTFFVLQFKENNSIRIYSSFLHYLWVVINLILLIILIIINFIGYNSLKKNRTPIINKYIEKSLSETSKYINETVQNGTKKL